MSTVHMYAYVVYDKAGKGSSAKKGSKDTPVPRTFFDIIELRLVPKAHRHEGHKARVRWEDKITKKVTSHYVTIKKISDNLEELEAIIVDDSGEIVEKHVKIFSQDVHDNLQNQKSTKKIQNAARGTANIRAQNDIAKESSIFDGIHLESELPVYQSPPITPIVTIDTPKLPSKKPLQEVPPDETSDANMVTTVVVSGQALTSQSSRLDRFWTLMGDLSQEATDENIKFLDRVLSALKVSQKPGENEIQKEPWPTAVPIFQLADSFKTPGKGKVTIHTSVDFYMNEVLKSNIEKRSFEYDSISQSMKKSWRKMVRQCLIEIYGKHLGEFSAKGARGMGRPRIDPDLYFGLWNWAKAWTDEDITEEEFIDYINKMAYNRRKSEKQIKSASKSLELSCQDKSEQHNSKASNVINTDRKRKRRSLTDPEVERQTSNEENKDKEHHIKKSLNKESEIVQSPQNFNKKAKVSCNEQENIAIGQNQDPWGNNVKAFNPGYYSYCGNYGPQYEVPYSTVHAYPSLPDNYAYDAHLSSFPSYVPTPIQQLGASNSRDIKNPHFEKL